MTKTFIVGLLATIVYCAAANAQSATGTLQGRVLDPTEGAVTAAQVTIENQNTGVKLTTTTNNSGAFVQLYLIPGEYRLSVEKPGFDKYVASDIRIAVQQTIDLAVALKVGQVSTTVEVSANTVQLSTSNSTISTVFNRQMMIDLPTGRNPFALASLSPGVSPSGGTGTNPSISGGRGGSNEITIDGTTVIVPENNVGTNDLGYQPIMDSIEEVSVITNSMAAEFGRSGGGVIAVASKSGTNKIHGSLFEFNRNQIYDANSWSNNRAGTKKGPVRQNSFGGSIGGPVLIPKIYDGRNRTFFFFSEQSTVRHNSQSGSSTVPTPEWRAGNFAGLKNGNGADIVLYDPATVAACVTCPSGVTYQRTPFVGNQIPVTRFDNVAKNMLAYYPQPTPGAFINNVNTQQNNYFRQGSSINNDHKLDTRVDHTVTDKFRLWARGSWSDNPNPGFNLWGNNATSGSGPQISTNYNMALNAVYTLNPSTVVNFNYGYARKIADRDPFSQGMDLKALGFPDAVVQAAAEQNLEFPSVGGMGGNGAISGLGQATFTALRIHGYDHEFRSDVSKIFSKHSVKFGGQFRKLYLNFRQNGQPSGQYNFGTLWTQQNVSNTTSTTQGTGFASFLLGLPNPNAVGGGPNSGGTLEHTYAAAQSSSYAGFYLQDEWKVTRALTLNFGLRWDADIPRTERYNRLSFFDVNTPSSINGKVPLLPGRTLNGAMKYVNANNRRQTPTDANNWGPRFSFAYQFANKTVFRGGYSVMYGGSIMQASGTSGSSGTLGFTSNTGMNSSFDGGRTVIATLSNPFPSGFNRPLGAVDGPTSGVNQNLGLGVGGGDGTVFTDYVSPMIQQWNANIQRELPGGVLVEAGYLGSGGHHLIDNESSGASLNSLPGSYMALGSQLRATVANPFQGIILNPTSSLAGATVSYNQLLRPFPHYTGVDGYRKPGANSIYHAFTLSVQKRYAHGLQLQVSYTNAKLIDDSSNSPQGGGGSGSKQDVFNRQADRSLSASDVSQRLVISSNYELPFGKGHPLMNNAPRAIDAILGGWQVNGVYTLQKGQPLQFSSGLNNNTFIFSAGQRLNSTGKSAKIAGNVEERTTLGTNGNRMGAFDTTVFTAAPDYTFGNLGRVSPDVRGAHTNSLDFSLFKAFRIVEGVNFRIQAEAYNALNHPIWGNPGTSLNNVATFGVIQSKNNNNRTGQIALRLSF